MAACAIPRVNPVDTSPCAMEVDKFNSNGNGKHSKYYHYWINITTENKQDGNLYDQIMGKIKNTLNYEEMVKSGDCYINQEAEHYLKTHRATRLYLDKIAFEIFDFYVYDKIITVDDVKFSVFIQFLKLKHEELLIPSTIKENGSLITILNREFNLRNNIDRKTDFWHNYRMHEFVKRINKNCEIFDLRFEQPAFCNTTLYPYQRHTLAWATDIEKTMPQIEIIGDKYIDMGSNLEIYFNYSAGDKDKDGNPNPNRFVGYNKLPKVQVMGGIICDEPGLGKTVQMLTLAITNRDIKTLILVPNVHIQTHWQREISKHFNLEMLGGDSSIKSWITIMTYQEFKTAFETKTINFKEYSRLIIDEIHELYGIAYSTNNQIFHIILNMNHFKYRWGITGTPFIDVDSLNNIIKYMVKFITKPDDFYNNQMGRYIFNQENIMPYLSRFTNQVVQSIIKLPSVSIHNLITNFSRPEMEIYMAEKAAQESMDVYFLRKLCCNALTAVSNTEQNSMTPEQLRRLTVDRFREKVSVEQAQLELLIGKKNRIEERIKLINESEKKIDNIIMLSEYKDRLNDCERQIIIQTAILERRKTVFESYMKITSDIEEIINTIHKKSDDCDHVHDCDDVHGPDNDQDMEIDDIEDGKMCFVCYGPFINEIALFIKCRHYICNGCFRNWHKNHPNTCPMCRTVADVGEISIIGIDNTKITGAKNIEILKLIKKSGEPFIIFTQFPEFINTIHNLLKVNDVVAYNYQDYIILSTENKAKVQVIILSSTNNASGIDLSFIHNVIIVEPFDNYVYGKEIEKQLIGRVHRINQTSDVNVYRLIIKDTIEETMYGLK
jgi:SNF2 family DNA or RNA helicase